MHSEILAKYAQDEYKIRVIIRPYGFGFLHMSLFIDSDASHTCGTWRHLVQFIKNKLLTRSMELDVKDFMLIEGEDILGFCAEEEKG